MLSYLLLSSQYAHRELPRASLSSVRLSKNGLFGSFCEQSLQFSRFRAVSYAAVWCEPFCLRLRSCYLPQHAGRIVQTGVSGLDSGGQSLPLRQSVQTTSGLELHACTEGASVAFRWFPRHANDCGLTVLSATRRYSLVQLQRRNTLVTFAPRRIPAILAAAGCI